MASTIRNLQKIFVGNIPWSVSHLELKNFFNQFGRVEKASVIFDKSTGCSKGFGFVVYDQSESGPDPLKKIESINSLVLEGHTLNIQPVFSNE